MTLPAEIILWGATGQARVLGEAVSYRGTRVVALFDNDPAVASPFPEIPVLHGITGLEGWLRQRGSAVGLGFSVAIGGHRGEVRLKIHRELTEKGLAPIEIVHPRAFVAGGVILGAGSQVLALAGVCAGATVGQQCIINTAATVDHECELGDGVHIGPGAHLAGLVKVEHCATVYTGASVAPRVRIGAHAIVGAGAVVLKDVPAKTVVVGSPARVIRERIDVEG